MRTTTVVGRRFAFIAFIAFIAAPSAAQQPYRAGSGIAIERYAFREADRVGVGTLMLTTVPLEAAVALGRGVDLQLAGGWARGELERNDGSRALVQGVVDTELRLRFGLGRDLLALTAIVQAPTGLASLSDDEADVAGMIAADVLPFRMTNWGSGGGAGVAAALARPLGAGFNGGFSAGYVIAREYEPLAGDFAYRPGNQLHLRAALDRTFRSSVKASMQVGMQRYGADRADGDNLFHAGTRVSGVGSLAFAAGSRSNAIIYAGHQHRAGGTFEAPSLSAFDAQRMSYAGAGARVPVASAVLQSVIDLRIVSGATSAAEGYTAGAGATLELDRRSFMIAPTIRFRFGNVRVRDGAESGFTGADLGVALRFGATPR